MAKTAVVKQFSSLMYATFIDQCKEQKNISYVHTYLSTRSREGWLLRSLLPYGRNSIRSDSPLGSINVKDPLKTVFFKIFRTDDKNPSRCEICPVSTNKSKPLIPHGSTCRPATMQRNPSTTYGLIHCYSLALYSDSTAFFSSTRQSTVYKTDQLVTKSKCHLVFPYEN